jgi:hypothetical protein
LFDKLSDYQLLKEYPAPWSWLVMNQCTNQKFVMCHVHCMNTYQYTFPVFSLVFLTFLFFSLFCGIPINISHVFFRRLHSISFLTRVFLLRCIPGTNAEENRLDIKQYVPKKICSVKLLFISVSALSRFRLLQVGYHVTTRRHNPEDLHHRDNLKSLNVLQEN